MATSIRLEPEIEQRLDYLATQTGRTKAYYLREIIYHRSGKERTWLGRLSIATKRSRL